VEIIFGKERLITSLRTLREDKILPSANHWQRKKYRTGTEKRELLSSTLL
jgi:hypothetical protein